jgi:eukaryotic-like serine/threonine-protein kinase
MVEPSNLPDSQRPESDATLDPLAETRMAPAEPIAPPPKSPTAAPKISDKEATPPADLLSETYTAPAEHGTLSLQVPAKDQKPLAAPSASPHDSLRETRLALSRLQEQVEGPNAATRLAPLSVPPKLDNPTETIAHASRPPDDVDPASGNTRVLDRPSGTTPSDQGSGIPMTLVVDSTKQPPVSPEAHDTPIVPTPGFSSIRAIPGMPQHVGDYEILGVLGRGGMGVVYKAKQKRLNRIVALKMILGGLHASDEDLRRFRQEAEASARLQHPNIVQIHEIGEMDGKPYFSLEYVDGGSLAGKMANEPQPAFAAAQLIEILARAMHYAHQRGIVHRDLKPANILLASAPPEGSSAAPVTSFGIPKITDFGLAKRMDVDLGQTQSGAILGTPSYMAPEQAGGRVREIGPATDVYALGAILYDLLTGRPPFKANTLADTLRQVQMVEPVSPGRLQPQVPRDLATICLKCLNKEPKKRYETGLDLAEDLGRFLAGEPIHARPASLLERTLKWSRRRPAIAALIAVSVLSFLALGIGGWWSAAKLFYANQRIIKANELAENERGRAEDNLEQALEAIDGVLTQVSVDLSEVPLMEKPRAKLLKKALALFEHLPREDQKTPKARFQSARAKERLGEVQGLLDNLPDAERAYGDAEAGLRELVASAPKQPEYRTELARTYHDEGMLYRKKGLLKEAEHSFREAMEQRTDLARAYPEEQIYLRDQAQSTYWLGTTLVRMRGKQAEAEKMYRDAIAMQKKLVTLKNDRSDAADLRRDYERDEARMLNNLGLLLGLIGRKQQAIDTFKSAAEIQSALATKNRDIPTIRREQARSLNNLGFQQWRTEGQTTTAETTFGQAVELLEELVRDFPSVPAYRDELASVYRTRGGLLQEGDRPAEADQAFRKAMEIHVALTKDFPDVPEYQSKLSDDCLALGKLHRRDYSSLTCEQMLAKALELQQDLTKRYPDSCEYHSNLAFTYKNIGTRIYQRISPEAPYLPRMIGTATLVSLESISSLICMGGCPNLASEMALASTVFANSVLSSEYLRQKTLHEAREPARRAVQEMKTALEIEPRRVDYLLILHDALKDLANAELEVRSHAEVAKIARELASLEPREVTTRLMAAEFLVRAMIQVRADARLDREAIARLEAQYASDALENLKEAGRIDSAYTLKKLPLNETFWRDALKRPDFKAVINELNDPSKRLVD